MANSYFKFKQFTVEQGNTAMKVGTDGVLLGAWCDVDDAKSILDVGTGTGLLSLMVAQRAANANVLAIDIENLLDAQLNFKKSPWSDRLELSQVAVQKLVGCKFEHIVSNPPYFNNSLQCPDKSRTSARHTGSLSYEELTENCARLLCDNGKISLILPSEAFENICSLFACCGLTPSRICWVRARQDMNVKRVLLEFSSQATEPIETEIFLDTHERHCLSQDYKELTKDYYLDK